MAQFIRGRQVGIQKDFSAEISEELFVLDDLRRFGVSSRITEIAYDPVQSLLAVGTARSQFGRGQVYVYGRGRISFTFQLPTQRASVKAIQFSADKLLCLDDTNDLSIFSMVDRKLVTSYAAPAPVACMASDPTLDFVMLGMQNGDVLAYDLDRQAVVPFRLPCFWSEKNPRVRNTPVVEISFHPRDIGTLLIAYVEGACIYSFKQNKPLKFFHYQLPRGAPGGDGDPTHIMADRSPKLTHTSWHPTGTFIMTTHEDSSLVFWDPWDGRVVQARSAFDTNVDKPGNNTSNAGSFAPRTAIRKIGWCANGSNPDDTGILIAGGASAMTPSQGMTFIELGKTPVYNTSSYQVLSQHFENPKRQHILPTPPGVEVVNFCLIPRTSPWYAGAHDPIAVIAVLSSGELTTMSFPSGYPITPTNQLHVSLTLVHPFVTSIGCSTVERPQWLGLIEKRPGGPKILKGGAEAARPMKRFENRNIVHTAHADGSVRLWDCGHADEIENESVLQADVGRALGRSDSLKISKVSFSGSSSELAVGMYAGEIAIFKWSRSNGQGQELRNRAHNDPGVLINVTSRKDPSLTQGFHPFTLLNEQNGPITALATCGVGFVAAGSQGGSIVLIDLRGPAIILRDQAAEFAKKDKKLSFRRQRDDHEQNWATSMSFSVMSADEDSYSSIMLHVGMVNGTVATYKILPAKNGTYSAQLAGSVQLDGQIIRLLPIDANTGRPASATPEAVGGLSRGIQIDGVLLAVSKVDAKLFKPCLSRGASKSWDTGTCESASIVHCLEMGKALLCLFSDGTARSFTLPGLSQIGRIKIDTILDKSRLTDAVISDAGDILGPTGPSEYALLNVWGTGEALSRSPDLLYNPEAIIPPRPTISGLQWVAGVQYITPSDLDVLIGGPNRPPSKRMIAQARADAEAKRQAGRPHEARQAGFPQASNANEESYWGYMQRQLNERTERLGIMSDSMDRLEDTSSQWVQNVSDYVNQQKKNLIMGAVKHKMGL